MIEELFRFLNLRCIQACELIEGRLSWEQLVPKIVNFQFEEHLRRDKQKKIIESLYHISDHEVFNQEVRQQIRFIVQRYRSKFREYSIDFASPSGNWFIVEQLKSLVLSCQKVVETVRLKIAKEHPSSWVTHLKMSFTIDKFRYLLQQYGSRMGLAHDLDNQIGHESYGISISDLIAESTRANIGIIKSMKQYEQNFKGYRNRLKRRKGKRVSCQQPETRIVEKDVKIKKVSPARKTIRDIREVSNPKPEPREKNSINNIKISLPPAMKRIEFPPQTVEKYQYPFLHGLIKKKQRKISTLPSDNLPTFRNENAASMPIEKTPLKKEYVSHSTHIYETKEKEHKNIFRNKRLFSNKRILVPEFEFNIQRLESVRVKKREESMKPEKVFLESPGCFNDELMKKDFNERLILYSKVVEE